MRSLKDALKISLFTGLAALAMPCSAEACAYEESGYNGLIPKYGDEDLTHAKYKEIEQFQGILIGIRRYQTIDKTVIMEFYLGNDKYAILVSNDDPSKSFKFVDVKGDGVFREKCGSDEEFKIPLWILIKYLPTPKTPV